MPFEASGPAGRAGWFEGTGLLGGDLRRDKVIGSGSWEMLDEASVGSLVETDIGNPSAPFKGRYNLLLHAG